MAADDISFNGMNFFLILFVIFLLLSYQRILIRILRNTTKDVSQDSSIQSPYSYYLQSSPSPKYSSSYYLQPSSSPSNIIYGQKMIDNPQLNRGGQCEFFGATTETIGSSTQPTLAACELACDAKFPNCKGVVYNPTTQGCLLKGAFVPQTGTFQSGSNTYYLTSEAAPFTVRTYSNQAGKSYVTDSNEIGNYTSASLGMCQRDCDNISDCIGYMFDTTNSKCSLRRGWGTDVVAPTSTVYYITGNTPTRIYDVITNVAY